MYERQKVLLGLVEAFGGELARTDCLKLLFLLGQQSGARRHYDFFPYLYGPFCHVAMRDKSRLEALGYLRSSRSFVLSEPKGHLSALGTSDRCAVLNLCSAVGRTRGRDLMRRVYLGFPTYCRRSRVLDRVLDTEEATAVRRTCLEDRAPSLFTIGYQGHSIDSFLRCLIEHDVNTVVDVRRNAFSMKRDFSRGALQRYLQKSGIDYIRVPELGIDSAQRRNLTDRDSYRSLLDTYEREVLPALHTQVSRVAGIALARRRVALMCFEADHECCHRHAVARAVAALNGVLPIVHLRGGESVSA